MSDANNAMYGVDAVGNLRNVYARKCACFLTEELPKYEERQWERVLAYHIDELLGEYNRGLEAMCNEYARIANDYARMSTPLPLPFPVKRH